MLTKQEILLGKDTRVESMRVREPRRAVLSNGSLGFYADGISFGLSLANHSDSESFLAHLVESRWLPERRILGGGRTGGVSF